MNDNVLFTLSIASRTADWFTMENASSSHENLSSICSFNSSSALSIVSSPDADTINLVTS